jgi:hypothetical protein
MLKEKTIKRTKRQKEKSPTGMEQRRFKKNVDWDKMSKSKKCQLAEVGTESIIAL